MGETLRKVAVIGGIRTPFCRGNTGYDDLTNLDLLTAALNGLVEKYHLQGEHIDEVVGGAVVTHARDFSLTREAVIGTKLAEDTPGITLSQACGTSLQAALGSAAKIAIGAIDSAIACGTDTVSDPPIELKRALAKRLAKVSSEKTVKGKATSLLSGFSLGDISVNPPAVAEPRTGLSMGQHCELMAKEWQIPRDEQDKLACESHKNAAAAYDAGFLDDLLVPTAGVYRDNNLRPDISLEKLSLLKPAFDKDGGTLTAANSTPLTDGAAAVLLASEDWAKAHGLKPQAWLTFGQHWGIDFVDAGKGLLMAPTIAVSKMLDRAGLSLQDFDFYEIHEAFAAQVLCTLKAWEDADYCKTMLGKDKPLGSIDRSKLNVKGSSLAYGHPFAATGARIIAQLAKILEENGGGRGLISICTAGGMGVCAILERPRDDIRAEQTKPAHEDEPAEPKATEAEAARAEVAPLPASVPDEQPAPPEVPGDPTSEAVRKQLY
ncbi:acetyl-CoA C-acetyltransferase [Rhodomicrobium vannielii ATCC 17100]|uniref:acetyl-CoA C-acetyltransferase n=1 Tax=Rhodomicrobium vannielii TaxID=1069 RepID=UPI00191A0A0E|nr:acetyl-CoA C-acetyltransferase [Rhodomicrobium vannielii]MBJ7535357.1 acetyl-CoA C-acetyltransferase [Rhodomicrobium vannielii ATCC 17100]